MRAGLAHLPATYTVDTPDGNDPPVKQKSWRDWQLLWADNPQLLLEQMTQFVWLSRLTCALDFSCSFGVTLLLALGKVFTYLTVVSVGLPIECHHWQTDVFRALGCFNAVHLCKTLHAYILWINLIVFQANINIVACLHQLLYVPLCLLVLTSPWKLCAANSVVVYKFSLL